MPSSPAERRAETVDPPASLYRCPYRGRNHQSIPMGGAGRLPLMPALLTMTPTRPALRLSVTARPIPAALSVIVSACGGPARPPSPSPRP
jgi:hypothetical protein